MPFINVKLSETLQEPQIECVKTELGKAIALLPGKSEAYLMVNIEDGCKLFFKGNQSAPTAMCEVSVFGNAPRGVCEKLTEEICKILEMQAAVAPERTYVKFSFIDTWGYNGYLF